MLTWINKESWEMMIFLPEAKQVKKCPRTTVCKISKYIQSERKQINESFYFPPDNEHTFSISYLHENPLLYVPTIEERIKAMNLQSVKK